MNISKIDYTSLIEKYQSLISSAADSIWEFAETAFQEHRSSSLLKSILEEQGFSISAPSEKLPTAFTARWGYGRPILGFLGEYDALPGLSGRHIDCRFPRLAVGRPFVPQVGIGIACHMAFGLEDKIGESCGDAFYAVPHFLHREGLGLERGHAVQDVFVIDVRDGLRVIRFYGSYHDCLPFDMQKYEKHWLQPNKALKVF